MKNYYHILGISPGAGEDEIRSAFRSKAKQFHPDLNSSEDARLRFIEVQQAYEILMDPAQRHNYESLLHEENLSRNEQERRERIYKIWVEHQQRVARRRTAMESVGLAEEENPGALKFWRVINLVYNIVFLFFFLIMMIIPLVMYVDQLSEAPEKQRSILIYLVPSFCGGAFLYYGYYFWFVLKTDRDRN